MNLNGEYIFSEIADGKEKRQNRILMKFKN